MGPSIAEYFGYLQSHWEDDYLAEAASIALQHLNWLHTYQFLIGLKLEFETLRAQIVNTSPMPSLYEAFATIDGDERQCRLIHPVIPVPVPTTESHPTSAD